MFRWEHFPFSIVFSIFVRRSDSVISGVFKTIISQVYSMYQFILLAATAAAPKAAGMDISLWSMVLKGGWLMIPIFLLSVIAIYIFCERFLILKKAGQTDPSLMEKIREHLYFGNKESAMSICDAENTPTARILKKGISHCDLPTVDLHMMLENSANLEVSVLEKGLSTLATASGMAPMIGFLGTVIGMVQAFYDMSMAGNNISMEILSKGIYTAMITTVAGLIVGIMAYFAYNTLVARIDNIISKLENTNSDFMEIIYDIHRNNPKK